MQCCVIVRQPNAYFTHRLANASIQRFFFFFCILLQFWVLCSIICLMTPHQVWALRDIQRLVSPFKDSLPHIIWLLVENNTCYLIGDFCKILGEIFPKSDYLSCYYQGNDASITRNLLTIDLWPGD